MVDSDEHRRRLAELCGGEIPEEYRKLLEDFPSELQTAQRSETSSENPEAVSDVELLNRLSDILEINLEARRGGVIDPEGEEFHWPDQLLVIGETGTGDYYCIDVSGEHPGVLQYLHQSIEFEVVAESLEEYVSLLLEAYVSGESKSP